MNRRRICTTISYKHWEILSKQVEKYATQQNVLEAALEIMLNYTEKELTEDEKFWLRLKEAHSQIIVDRTPFKMLLDTADVDALNKYFSQNKSIEHAVEYFYQKPFAECSLKEVIHGIVFNVKVINWFDYVNIIEKSSYYDLIITHSLGLNGSKVNSIPIENAFKNHGIKTVSTISEKSIFIKIFKETKTFEEV